MQTLPTDNFRQLMLEAEEYIRLNPEIGFKEYKTQAYLIEKMTELGYTVETFSDITGFTAVYDSKRQGPTLLIFAELDALINPAHPECDKKTGAVHSCAHNVQCATLLGVAGALMQSAPNISGKVKFCFVPAEEGIDYDYRKGLIEKGILKYNWGKPEFIRRGTFSDCELAFMVHASPKDFGDKKFYINLGNNGNIIKQTTFIGKSAHAGGAPHLGINALNAASTAISTINSLRETFLEKDHIRFHSIITNGGYAVNTVPEKVVINSYVRGANVKALNEANERINRAIKGVAVAFGCNVTIEDRAGSMPVSNDKGMIDCAIEVISNTFGKESLNSSTDWGTICTDFGDVSSLMPSVHLYTCGMNGPLHGTTSNGGDLEISVIDSAKFQYAYIVELLKDGAKRAKDIISCFKPTFENLDQYLKQKDRFSSPLLPKIEYQEDGNIIINP